MPEIVYVKSGRRYRPIGIHGAVYGPGVYVVTERPPGVHTEHWIGRVGDVPDPLAAAAVWQHWETIARAVTRHQQRLGLSGAAATVADVVCRAIAEAEERRARWPR